MKIAYYEENNYHTEILATFIEPFITTINSPNNSITIFNDSDNSDYISYFHKIIQFELKKINEFITIYDQFDIIIIGTSSSCSFLCNQNINLDLIKSKIYMISHLKEDIENVKRFKNIVLTPLNNCESTNYILPINSLFTNKIKNYYPIITIGLVGRFKDSNRDTKDLINLITNYSHLDFKIKIFTRNKKFIPHELNQLQNKYPDKLKIYYKVTTTNLINQLKDINYFCPLSSKNSWYLKDRLSGMIPFAYNFNTPLLLDKLTNQIYNLKSPIIYANSLTDIIEQLCTKTKVDYDKLIDNLIDEKNEIAIKNNIILKELYGII